MRPRPALALTAAALLLAGCSSSNGTAATDLPGALVTTAGTTPAGTTPASTAAATTAPTHTAGATPSARASATANRTPAARRTTAAPTVVTTSARPTQRPPAKPTPRVTTPPPATGTFPLSISGRAFHPQFFSIPRGTTVQVTNDDPYAHDWTSNSGVWASGSLGFHGTYSYRFMNKGSFNFSCTIHPDMTGRVTVT